jgi:hypothetical protein
MTMKIRHQVAFYSYWLLFIIIPAFLPIFCLGISFVTVIATYPLLVILCMIGERGLRIWLKLFHVT